MRSERSSYIPRVMPSTHICTFLVLIQGNRPLLLYNSQFSHPHYPNHCNPNRAQAAWTSGHYTGRSAQKTNENRDPSTFSGKSNLHTQTQTGTTSCLSMDQLAALDRGGVHGLNVPAKKGWARGMGEQVSTAAAEAAVKATAGKHRCGA